MVTYNFTNANRPLFYKLCSTKLVVVFVGLLVFSLAHQAHADVFSSLFSLFAETKKETSASRTSIEKIPLMSAPKRAGVRNEIRTPLSETVLDGKVGVRGQGSTEPAYPTLYIVSTGDTLSSVSELFDLQPETILEANPRTDNTLRVGEALLIPPFDGTLVRTKEKETLHQIASRMNTEAMSLARANSISIDTVFEADDVLMIPRVGKGFRTTISTVGKPATISEYKGYFSHPVPGAIKTQGIHGHNAVDLAAPLKTPVQAATEGRVLVAQVSGWNGGYGTYVVIEHPNGTKTLYGHLHSLSVKNGDTVTQGQEIGLLGSTGHSTGPHVHFEVWGAKNPF
jgi:murein DD-endopeptidase MepM/ murein hydrolase activator NlpD